MYKFAKVKINDNNYILHANQSKVDEAIDYLERHSDTPIETLQDNLVENFDSKLFLEDDINTYTIYNREEYLKKAYFYLYEAGGYLVDYLRDTEEESDKIEALYKLKNTVVEITATLGKIVNKEEK
jgi:CRISPR/Cas system CMR-associated protein Cmr1 (group 7 of RAMP superfamily)